MRWGHHEPRQLVIRSPGSDCRMRANVARASLSIKSHYGIWRMGPSECANESRECRHTTPGLSRPISTTHGRRRFRRRPHATWTTSTMNDRACTDAFGNAGSRSWSAWAHDLLPGINRRTDASVCRTVRRGRLEHRHRHHGTGSRRSLARALASLSTAAAIAGRRHLAVFRRGLDRWDRQSDRAADLEFAHALSVPTTCLEMCCRAASDARGA